MAKAKTRNGPEARAWAKSQQASCQLDRVSPRPRRSKRGSRPARGATRRPRFERLAPTASARIELLEGPQKQRVILLPSSRSLRSSDVETSSFLPAPGRRRTGRASR